MKWPESENKRIPEGFYRFRINREPEFRKFPYSDKQGNKKEGTKIVLYIKGLNDKGEFSHVEGIPVWDPRYEELCQALGVEHGKDIEVSGMTFDGYIKHEADKNDPSKIYPRLYGIQANDAPIASANTDDDVPF